MATANSNIEEAFKNSDWSTICAALMPHFNDYLARRSKNIFECELATSIDHITTVPALYNDGAGTMKQVIIPMKLFTKDVDAALVKVSEATDNANTAANTANAAAKEATDATADLEAKKKEVDAAVEASKTQTEAAKQATEDTLASKTAIEENETARQAAETERANAEASRVNTEKARVSAESSRASAEKTRVSNETTRQNQEATRNTNEVARNDAETTRNTNETTRQNQESTRQSNETARKNAETTRESNESTRKTNETNRVDAEAARVKAETARVEAEKARVTAETKRETDFATSKAAADKATADANSMASHPPYVDTDGYFYRWDVSTKAYNKTDVNLTGKAFQIKKVFASVAAMNAVSADTFDENDFILINTADVEDEDNAKLYVVAIDGNGKKFYSYLVDMSGFRGFTGKTPQFIIGTVTTLAEDASATASVSSSGTDTDGNPVYKLNLGIPKGIRLRFSDLTDADKAELMKPATDAAAASKTQTEACKTATDNANAATTKATTATTNANTATTNANNAATKANTAATNADTATAASKVQTDLAKELNDHPQKQGDNGNWWKWNPDTDEYEDTGILARGGAMYPTFKHTGNKLYIVDYGSNVSERVVKKGNKLVFKI